MRRHTPTLFPHPEQDIQQVEDADEADWNIPVPLTYSAQSMPASPVPLASHRSRVKPRLMHSITSKLNTHIPPYGPLRSGSDTYQQFVRRYRSHGDSYDDPDSYYFHRNFGELVDAGDSDDDDLSRLSASSSGIISRTAVHSIESEPTQPATLEERERLEWQTMLASVLDGDVLKSEKTRIADSLESSADEQNSIHLNVWFGIRAKFRGITVEQERKNLEERRLRIVDSVIEEIMSFRVDPGGDNDTTFALKQTNALMRRLEVAQSLYPSLRAFHLDKPASMHPEFQARCDALNTWSTVLISLREKITLLRRWTGSETLDVTQPNTKTEVVMGLDSSNPADDSRTEIVDGRSFVERVLKEESMQRTFEKGFLSTVHSFLGTARDAQVNHSVLLKEMHLPTFENELVPLISFPTKLAQAGLCVLLDYVQKLKDPDVLIIDQLTEDLKLNIGLACTLKRQYEVFLTPDPGGNWNLPQCISEDYDATILEALSVFFKLIHWKFKSDVKGVYFKETDILEAHWATFHDVSLTTSGGSSLVSTQLCALTNKLMVRVTNYFETQIRVPIPISGDVSNGRTHNISVSGVQNYPLNATSTNRKMTDEQMVSWYGKVLDSVRWRYRKLQRFTRLLTQKFSNSAEYDLEDVTFDRFISQLVATDHLLVYTQSFEEDGTYVVASSVLGQQPDTIRRMLTESFHVNEFLDDGIRMDGYNTPSGDEYEQSGYLLLLSPRNQFLWNGLVLMLDIPKVELDMKDNRVRLIADGSQRRLALAKQQFAENFLQVDEDGEAIDAEPRPLPCIVEQQAHLSTVNRELRKIARAINRLAESVVDSVHHVRSSLKTVSGCQQLLENWYLFASEHGQHAQKYLEPTSLTKFNRLLIKFAISWVSFICDDCDPTDGRTFKSAVNALEFALHWTRRNSILELPNEQFEMLRQKVASCMTLLISHFDILGARSTIEARREKEKQEDLLRKQTLNVHHDSVNGSQPPSDNDDSAHYTSPLAYTDASVRAFWEKAAKFIQRIECERAAGNGARAFGRVLDAEKPEDRSLAFLASLNTQIQWQQGRFIAAGAFGSVYLAVNLDSGSPMAVKEIKFQELSNLPNFYAQIKDELGVMQLLHHPNIVEYYGIEVHRDRVYIFEEYCQGGSLAALLEHGRIEDERIIQAYTLQMLEGLAYLHVNGIVHRDVKPDNILLDHLGVIKFVDFGAAKILAKSQRSIQQRSRVALDQCSAESTCASSNLRNSLTGTPMYMSPEVIKDDKCGRYGAMDIWSMGCVVLEFATGKKPWSNLDNEWAIMFHIGVATQHPPLPEPGQLSELGINFIKECLTIDPVKRPTAVELMDHQWMLEFRETLLRYEEAEISTSPPTEMPMDESYANATVAEHVAMLKRKQVEMIQSPSSNSSAVETPLPRPDSSFLLPS